MGNITTGNKRKTGSILEYEVRKPISVASADFVWNGNSNKPAFFKIVTTEDCSLNVVLAGETDPGTAALNLTAQGLFPFKAGEGSNAKVVKVYHDDTNVINGLMWAVR
jgi:hypothetical protein